MFPCRWSLDDVVYEGTIESLDQKRGRVRVRFLGYNNEDTVPLDQLYRSKGVEWREEQLDDASYDFNTGDIEEDIHKLIDENPDVFSDLPGIPSFSNLTVTEKVKSKRSKDDSSKVKRSKSKSEKHKVKSRSERTEPNRPGPPTIPGLSNIDQTLNFGSPFEIPAGQSIPPFSDLTPPLGEFLNLNGGSSFSNPEGRFPPLLAPPPPPLPFLSPDGSAVNDEVRSLDQDQNGIGQ